jgi:hypothetical protein
MGILAIFSSAIELEVDQEILEMEIIEVFVGWEILWGGVAFVLEKRKLKLLTN